MIITYSKILYQINTLLVVNIRKCDESLKLIANPDLFHGYLYIFYISINSKKTILNNIYAKVLSDEELHSW